MPMKFGGSSGGSASAVITGFNATTKVTTVAVTDNTGANVPDGTSVGIYVDGSGSAYATNTTTSGVASVTLTGLDTTLGHTLTPKTTISQAVTGATVTYTPSFGVASFTGSQAVRRTASGLNPTADNATATLTVSGGVITGQSANTGGANYEPGVWQWVTASGGNTTPFRGQVQGKSDGTLDWTTFGFTGTGHDGVALSAGTGYAGSTSAAVFTRRVTSLIIAVRLKQTTGAVNGDLLINSISSLINVPMLTGFKLRTDIGSGPQYRATTTANLSSTVTQDHIVALDLKQTYNASPNPGQQIYLNDLAAGPVPTTYNQFTDGTALGFVDLSNTSMSSLTIGANQAGTGNFAHADVEYVYIAWGLNARDSVTGQLPDFSSQTIRNRFLPGSINLTNGTGPTGRQPQVFMTGDSLKTGVNLGTGGTFGTIVGTL